MLQKIKEKEKKSNNFLLPTPQMLHISGVFFTNDGYQAAWMPQVAPPASVAAYWAEDVQYNGRQS